MSRKITSYFKQVKNVPEERSEEHLNTTTQFYENCLSEQQNVKCAEECIHIQIKATLGSKLNEMKQKYDNVKEAVKICQEIVEDKNIEIEYLRKQINEIRTVENSVLGTVTNTDNPGSVAAVNTPRNSNITPNSVNNTNSFSAFEKDFNDVQLCTFRSVGPNIRDDSQFVNSVIKVLYDENLHILTKKSVTGRSKPGKTKEAVTPEKHAIVKSIFTERIHSVTENDSERASRKKQLNKLIRYVIHNITKTSDRKETEKKYVSDSK